MKYEDYLAADNKRRTEEFKVHKAHLAKMEKIAEKQLKTQQNLVSKVERLIKSDIAERKKK